ncbi:MAG: hypothetical protein NT117_09690 [Gammaproteobacteria bacterium]|nr:hypothetical protein [Gammaproteobacteria bacterium]
MFRSFFAVISGLFAMMIVITFTQIANVKLFYPPPAGLDFNDKVAVATYVQTMPWQAVAVVVLSWLLGTYIGATVAARISKDHAMVCAMTIGIVDVVLTAINALSIPHPTWALAMGLLLPIPLAWLAGRQAAQKGLASTR